MTEKYCCICDSNVDSFYPWEGRQKNVFMEQFKTIGSDVNNFTCPNCGCHDRVRHLHLFFTHFGIYQMLIGKRILYVAPEIHLYNKILQFSKDIVLGDLNPEVYRGNFNQIVKINLVDPGFPESSFDMVIANHVLEHITDYKKALRQIFYVLKQNGIAILQTPFSPMILNNFEDPLIDTDAKRNSFYGQRDHVRVFGLNLFNDIEEAGFDLSYYRHDEVLKQFDSQRYGVNSRESFIVGQKKS